MTPRKRSASAPRPLVVDRVEEDEAVLELDGRELRLPRAWLPGGAREGSTLLLSVTTNDEASTLTLRLDPGQGAKAQAETQALLARLRS